MTLRRIGICVIFIYIFLPSNLCLNLLPETNGTLNHLYQLELNNTSQQVIEYHVSTEMLGDLKKTNLRVRVEIMEDDMKPGECPLLFAVHQRQQIFSMELPYYSPSSSGEQSISMTEYKTAARSLCLDTSLTNWVIVVVVSTCSDRNLSYTVVLELRDDLSVPIKNGIVETRTSPTSPVYFRFDFPEDIDIVLITVESDDNACMTLSIQQPKCPVFDAESNVHYTGFWQTVTHLTGLNVMKRDFPDGFFIVFVVNDDDDSCTNKNGYDSSARHLVYQKRDNTKLVREKSVKFTIARSLHENEYTWPTFFPLVLYIPILIVTLLIFCIFHRHTVNNFVEKHEKYETEFRLRSGVYMIDDNNELDGNAMERLEKKSNRYVWSMVTISMFYCIPVFQLITNYLRVVYRTGEQDVCYYNNLCSLPLGYLMDFNHLYSNIGYIILGPAFMGFVRIRQLTVGTRELFHYDDTGICFNAMPKIRRRREYGTYHHYGLYFALGFALFMEGLLSAGYHICPNRSNFQFDTSFMYAMAVLSYIKIYQFRHPVHMSESLAFLALAIVAACVVFGLITESVAFRIVVSVLHILFVLVFQFYMLYTTRMKRGRFDEELTNLQVFTGICRELLGGVEKPEFLVRHHPNKTLFWWTLIWNILLIVNSWTLVYGQNFATQVLYLWLANMAIYVVYYAIMKGIHGEYKGLANLQPIIYAVVALLFWVPGLYLFMRPLSTWDVSPAASRTNNGECMLFNFYDNHDVWHILSAGGLFFSFMFFLTVDDGLMGKHQDSIPVF